MRTPRTRALVLAILPLSAVSLAQAPQPYEPLAFLVGHCWQGAFPAGATTDKHCFSWIYGNKFVRDEHVVHHADGSPDGLGESIYMWDAAAGKLEYLYIESGGGFSRGFVTREADVLVFPPTQYLENGKTQTYRSSWHRAAADAYEVVTEFQVKEHWVPGFSVHMQKLPQSTP
jgi:hypothetical protein